ncbi:carbamoyltransferase C-terminal domain-containing protein [uncultured Draconibacterium sp.]|uniref:carbamoyltransferase C-terminal domain-containing protein n=1 Tax=uncultured Draconibacterium sp. TaxID=1573823 RepID=UPI0025EED57D|nr:carbamoyltransferase C-terminal domain-containing protein [uncultured Draconibacterium sp.]
MDKNKPTLAIYGIQDRFDYEHPFYVHDHNLALMQNGKVEWFLQQERISRRKRDNSLHIHLKSILKEKKLLGKDYDLFFVDNVVGRTFLLQSGEVRFEAPLNNELSTDLEKGKCWWFGEEKEAWVLNHELAHMFSCLPFYGNLQDNSLLVHFDGGASLSNFSAAVYKNNQLDWIEYHWDLKPYSTLFNANALVFAIIGAKLPEQNAVPGKFMGFSGLGNYRSELGDWLKSNNFFQDIWGKTSVFFEAAKKEWGVDLKSFNQKDPFIQDVAATLQELFSQAILNKLKELQEKTGAENLYYTGGSALNIVANTRIVNSKVFKQVFIPPCTEDSGLALGAAAFAEWKKHGKVEAHSAYLNNWGIENYKADFSEETIAEVAEQLAANKLIGICNNFGEAGPRALGNRSILAFAGSKELSKKLSTEKKGREWYRPLAPVALEENVKYFTGQSEVHPLSKFMLLDFAVLPEKQQEIAGAIHADGTARFQTISKETDNPFLFALLKQLDEKNGIKALINTSFNVGGEPIVHTEEDALQSAKKMQLNGVVLNGKFVPL